MLLAKIFLSFWLFFLSFLIAPIPTFAQEATPAESTQILNSQLPTTVSPTSPLFTDLLMQNVFHSLSCIAVGQSTIGQPCLTYQISKDAQGVVSGVPVLSQVNTSGGVLGATTSLIGALYNNPPVRTTDYLASVGKDLGIIKEAQAQVVGSGAKVLNPIFSLWQVSRNIAYLVTVVIFVIIGFMIIFRQKINPQTVITAQAALPGLVISLILISFSYFLASLISDLSFIGTNLVGYYFSAAQGRPPQDLVSDISDQNMLTLFSRFIGIVGSGEATHALEIVFNNAGKNVQDFMRFAAGLMAFQYGNQLGHAVPFVGDLAGIIVGLGSSLGTAAAAPQIFGQVLTWASMVVLLYSMIKLLFRLINTYLSIIFLTVTGPFHFLAASLPGRQGLATNWILNFISNVLAFPAVLAVFYFAAFLLGRSFGPLTISSLPEIRNDGAVPVAYAQEERRQLISTDTFPLFGGLDTTLITIILALGALIATPAIPDVINRSIGRVSAAGQMLGQEISGNMRSGQGYGSQGQQIGQIGGKLSQDYSHLRGVDPGYSPAEHIRIANRDISDWTPFNPGGNLTSGWRTWRPFGKKRAG